MISYYTGDILYSNKPYGSGALKSEMTFCMKLVYSIIYIYSIVPRTTGII